jgi:hypothetical protein
LKETRKVINASDLTVGERAFCPRAMDAAISGWHKQVQWAIQVTWIQNYFVVLSARLP